MPTQAATVSELSADQVRKAVDLSALAFTTTADLEPQALLVGQERADQALRIGLDMPQPGYNIFICGLEGADSQTQIATLLRQRATALPTFHRI